VVIRRTPKATESKTGRIDFRLAVNQEHMKHNYMSVPSAAVSLCLAMTASSVFAADPPLAFRSIKLGDSIASVQSAATNEFAYVKQPKIDEVISVTAGDGQGTDLDNCPVSAPPSRGWNCLRARFNLWPGPDGHRLSIITVSQSFTPPILAATILEKLQETYGVPRKKYEKAEIAEIEPDTLSQQTDDIGLLWGGNKTPQPPFRPETFAIANDYSRIGGKYVTAVVYRKGSAVSGYELQIVDSDRVVAAMQASKTRRSKEAAAQQRANVDALKF
jgi:hypothetical protein